MSLQQINLLNPQLLTPHVAFSSKTIAWMLAGVVVLGIGLYGVVESGAGKVRQQLDQTQAQRDTLQAQIDALTQPTEDGLTPEDKRAQSLAQERQRVDQLHKLLVVLGAGGDGTNFSTRLQALAQGGVHGVWLTGVEFSDSAFRLEGRALQPASIPDYLAVLSKRPALKDLPLTGFSILPSEAGEDPKAVQPGVAFAVNPAKEGE